jgi:hypothetical protein
MTALTKKSALDADVPRTGRAADAYEVARTALLLNRPKPRSAEYANRANCASRDFMPARHAVTLHRISGHLHKLAERGCNEDLGCRECGGDGLRRHTLPSGAKAVAMTSPTCRACAGHGTTVGRRLERLRADAREIAEHYGMSVFFQTDCRGCSLYVGEAADMNDQRYNNGHAVVRMGR